jgi:hypothetical protein
MIFELSYFKADFFKVMSKPVRIQILDKQNVNYIAESLEINAYGDISFVGSATRSQSANES